MPVIVPMAAYTVGKGIFAYSYFGIVDNYKMILLTNA